MLRSWSEVAWFEVFGFYRTLRPGQVERTVKNNWRRTVKQMAVQCRPPSALTPCPVFIRVDEGGPECVLDRDESVVRGKCVCVCVCVCVCENRRSRWLSFIHVLQCKQRLHEHKRLLRRVEQTESALLIFKWWRSYWTPDSLHKSANFRSCWVKTNFINVMKLYLWQILNHWSLLINSALNVIYKADYHPKSHQTPFTNQLI